MNDKAATNHEHAECLTHDIVIYGGTPGGVCAAVAAARGGASVLLIEQTGHVGGLSTSGINTSEAEHILPCSFSGLALDFFKRLGQRYGLDVPLHRWEPHVAEEEFLRLLDENKVSLRYNARVETVAKSAAKISSITLDNGASVHARVFIDASYEGDLMARAGVDCTSGREPVSQYNEPLAGMRFVESPDEVAEYEGPPTADDVIPVSPYGNDGKLLPGFTTLDAIQPGMGDHKVMCYNFRLTLSRSADRVAITAPAGYDPQRYIILSRYFKIAPETALTDLLDFYPFPSGRYNNVSDPMKQVVPTDKWELNNRQNAIISLGYFGGQFDYPEADYQRRREIWQDHRDYTQGLLYFLANDPSVPDAVRRDMQQWGLAHDEYTDHGNWPYYLYVREARRMRGQYVITQHDIQKQRTKPDTVMLGSHWIDSHHVQRVAVSKTGYRNEGRIWTEVKEPFAIPYRALAPKPEDCTNLLVPVCVSASHVAFCSIRLESTWMSLGHAAGTAARLALDSAQSVQDIDISTLQNTLRAEGMILE